MLERWNMLAMQSELDIPTVSLHYVPFVCLFVCLSIGDKLQSSLKLVKCDTGFRLLWHLSTSTLTERQGMSFWGRQKCPAKPNPGQHWGQEAR